jgi:hypothetical protein
MSRGENSYYFQWFVRHLVARGYLTMLYVAREKLTKFNRFLLTVLIFSVQYHIPR